MIKYLISIAFISLSLAQAYSQAYTDLLLYSEWDLNSTARNMGYGGALTTLGADFSAASNNPAGLSTFRKSEFMITPGVKINKSETSIDGLSSGASNRTAVPLNNLSLAIVSKPRNVKWKSIVFGLGYNNLRSYKANVFYDNDTQVGSITQQWANQANNNDWDPFSSDLAEATGAIFADTDGTYYSDFDNYTSGVPRESVQLVKGNYGLIDMAFAANYNNMLQVGLSFGIPILNYSLNRQYTEWDRDSDIQYFEELTFEENDTQAGVGFNIKAGIIYQAVKGLKFSLAYHSPTWLSINDQFINELRYKYVGDNGEVSNLTDTSPDGVFDYNVKTPSRLISGVGVVIKNRATISGEVEFLDYGNGSYNLTKNVSDAATRTYEQELNQAITRNLGTVVNFRFGAEYILQDKFGFRAGVSSRGNPYQDLTTRTWAYGFGGGYRNNDFSADLGFRLGKVSSTTSPYEQARFSAETTSRLTDIILSIGFRF